MQRLRIKEIAQAKGFSMASLSRKADMDVKTIQKLFNEPDCDPYLSTLRTVAKVLGVSMRDLFDEDEHEDSSGPEETSLLE